MIGPIITGYLLFAIVVVILACWMFKLEKSDVTARDFLVLIALSLVPLLNIVAFIGFAWGVINLTEILNKKLF